LQQANNLQRTRLSYHYSFSKKEENDMNFSNKKTKLLKTLLAGAMFAASFGVLPALAKEPVSLKDFELAKFFEDAQISPNGKLIAFVRNQSVKKDSGDTDFVIVLDRATNKQTVVGEGSSPRWSPDGSKLFYDDYNEDYQIRIVRSDNFNQISTVKADFLIEAPTWSPDSKQIAFRRYVSTERDDPIEAEIAKLSPTGKVRTDAAYVTDRLHYRIDEENLPGGRLGRTHVFVADVATGETKQLTTGPWHAGARETIALSGFSSALGWSADSKKIYFDGLQVPDSEVDSIINESFIYEVNAATSAVKKLFDTEGKKDFWQSPVVSPDGKKIAIAGYTWNGSIRDNVIAIHFYDVATGALDKVDAIGETELDTMFWSSNSTLVAATYNKGQTLTYTINRGSGLATQIDIGEPASVNATSASNSGEIAGYFYTTTRLPEVFTYNGTFKRVTNGNSFLDNRLLGRTTAVWSTAPDGVRMQSVVTYPPGYNSANKYPTVVWPHGGPYNFASIEMFGEDNITAKWFAGLGYIVIQPNYRGSQSFGNAFAGLLPEGDFDSKTVDDLNAAIAAVGSVDRKRLYIFGQSAGGAYVGYMVANTNLFRAAVGQCGAYDYISDVLTTDEVLYSLTRFKKPFWEDRTAWDASSAIQNVKKVKTPVMLIHGPEDARINFQQSQAFFSALKLLGVDSRLVSLTGNGHCTDDWENLQRTLLHTKSWFDKYSTPIAN
jgi:dipeptidyl aminopeptidase/acylaminoacyl peptidase